MIFVQALDLCQIVLLQLVFNSVGDTFRALFENAQKTCLASCSAASCKVRLQWLADARPEQPPAYISRVAIHLDRHDRHASSLSWQANERNSRLPLPSAREQHWRAAMNAQCVARTQFVRAAER